MAAMVDDKIWWFLGIFWESPGSYIQTTPKKTGGLVSFPPRTVVGLGCSDDVLGSLPRGTCLTAAVNIVLPALSTQKQEWLQRFRILGLDFALLLILPGYVNYKKSQFS